MSIKAFFAAALILASASAAALTVGDPNSVFDTGKGGLRAVAVTPTMAGPYETNGKRDVAAFNDPRLVGGKFMFVEFESGFAINGHVMVMDRKQSKSGDKPITAEHLANEMLKTVGFTLDRSTKFDGPKVNIPGVTVVTYKASGHAIFEQGEKSDGKKQFMIVQAVSFPGQTKGYATMITITENAGAFDADPARYESLAKQNFISLSKGLTVSEN